MKFDVWVLKKDGEELEFEGVSRVSMVDMDDNTHNLLIFPKGVIDDEVIIKFSDIQYFTTM